MVLNGGVIIQLWRQQYVSFRILFIMFVQPIRNFNFTQILTEHTIIFLREAPGCGCATPLHIMNVNRSGNTHQNQSHR